MDYSTTLSPKKSYKFMMLLPVGLLVIVLLMSLGTGTGLFTWFYADASQIIWTITALILVWLIPGLVLLHWLWSGKPLALDERIMLAFGAGMIIPPVVLNVLSVVGIRWGGWQTWLYVLAALAAFIWQQWHNNSSIKHAIQHFSWWVFVGILLLCSLIILRLYMVRDLIVPMWNDSYHHTLITQLIADHDGLFKSWEPYAQLYSFTYHYGFHANGVFFHWLTGIDTAQSVILYGQLTNVAAVTSAYVLTTRLGGSSLAGIGAFAATAFLNTMPTYYVNWGRYTQLQGQVLLVVMLITWISVIETGWNWRGISFAALATSGLILTHYLVTLFGAVFLASYLLIWLARDTRWHNVRRVIVLSSTITCIALVVTLPWTVNIIEGRLTKIAGSYLSGNNAYGLSVATFTTLNPTYLKIYLTFAALVGLWLALARRNWHMLLCVVWTILLEVLVVPYVFSLPFTGVFSGFAVSIALYLTVIPLAAYGLGDIVSYTSRYRAIYSIVVMVGALASVVWASSWQPRIINDTNTMLFTPADQQAMTWIRQNTDQNAAFLINAYPGYARSVYIADDGGTWIPFLAGRRTTLPPMTYGAEKGLTPTSIVQVRDFYNRLYEHPLPDQSAIQLCLDAGIKYIYIGPHVGTVSELQRIDVQKLRYLPQQFPIVYERDGVVIFEIKSTP